MVTQDTDWGLVELGCTPAWPASRAVCLTSLEMSSVLFYLWRNGARVTASSRDNSKAFCVICYKTGTWEDSLQDFLPDPERGGKVMSTEFSPGWISFQLGSLNPGVHHL